MKVLFSTVLCILIDSKVLLTSTTIERVFISSTTPMDSSCTELDPPSLMTVSADKTSAVLVWSTSQKDIYCNPDALNVSCIALPEENQYGWKWVKNSTVVNREVNTLINTTVILEDLSEFTNYTCTAVLLSVEDLSNYTETKFQTRSEVSTSPLNLTVVANNSRDFTIRWDKPLKNPGVLSTYHVHIESKGPNYYLPSNCKKDIFDKWNQTTIEQYRFWEASPDFLYVVTVFLENSAGNSSHVTINVTTDKAASEPITDLVKENSTLNIEANIFNLKLSWTMPCNTNGPITYFEIKLMGTYIENYSISDEKTVTVNATDNVKYSTVIELNPATKYDIEIRANGLHEMGELYKETFLTKDNFPGAPILNDIIGNESTNLYISWEIPQRKAGKIINYTVFISSLGPDYDIDPVRCSINESIWNKTLDSDEVTYTFTHARPYYNYKVSVVAATSRGYGEPSTTEGRTAASIPEKPEELTFEFLNQNTTGMVTWKTPCNINGPIDGFVVEVIGNYSEDHFRNIVNTSVHQYENKTYIYNYSISLSESYSYEVKIWATLDNGATGLSSSKYFSTPDGYPEAPVHVDINEISEKSFDISWNRPIKRNGRILDYKLYVTPEGPSYETSCITNNSVFNYTINGDDLNFTFVKGEPYYNYSISIAARTSRGLGESITKNVRTAPSFPENVREMRFTRSIPTEEKYNAYLDIWFESPCKCNGPLLHYVLILTNQNNSPVEKLISFTTSFNKIPLRPEYQYEFSIQTNNTIKTNISASKNFTSPSGIPTFHKSFHNLCIRPGATSATLDLRKSYFNNENGEINYMAILLSDVNNTGGYFSNWSLWPVDNEFYQVTENYWAPFLDHDNVTFTIGTGYCNKSHCNKILQSGKDYFVIIRVFTKDFYKDSSSIHFRTVLESNSKMSVILGVTFGLVAFALLIVTGFLIWRRNVFKKSSRKPSPNGNTSLPIHKFVQYFKNLENNREIFTEQFMLLTEKSKEIMATHTTTIAELTENRRKNRYTNILPYDATRVKLLIDEDDEIGSDYINASYIKGYSGNTEYIATQGPLPTTCRDFWKMVIQENVSIIVMVTQFVEENKEKCYKYFPNNHESMKIGDNLEIKCTVELHFGTYCVRTIQVQKDSTQVTVTHMQFLDWPDFNVPKGTDTMLQFCHQMRERLKLEGGYAIVHCSAGVGRTGTLIATDIIIQNINAGHNIDIFNTVLDLRKQRMFMVQAQKQYIYIHNLIKDTLESQTAGLNDNMEPIYENHSALQLKSDDDNLIDKETESQF